MNNLKKDILISKNKVILVLTLATLIILFSSFISAITISSRILQSSDDAEERSIWYIPTSSSDLELVYDGSNQEVGMRFQNINIPKNAIINNAYIEFRTDEANIGITNLNIFAQNIDNAPTFTSSRADISGRAKTSSYVLWNNIPSWNTISELHQTPDLSLLVQEIINRPGWAEGNSIAFIVTGTGERTATSYDGNRQNAPLLVIDYSIEEEVVYACNDNLDNDNDGLIDYPEDIGCDSTIDNDEYNEIIYPCTFITAYWNPTYAIEGDLVELNLEGENCDGEEISFEIWEDDGTLPDDLAFIQPTNAFFSGNFLTIPWIAEWNGDQAGNLENYFIATLVSNNDIQINSNNEINGRLEVSEAEIISECIDTDGDLYGNPASVSCIFSELDCNDNDFSINPRQTELCENGIDDNCNNLIDENCNGDSFRFVSWADTQSVNQIQLDQLSQLSEQISALNPAFTLYVGDLEDSGFTLEGITDWADAINGGIYRSDSSNGILDITFPVRGNHDRLDTEGWQNYFEIIDIANNVGVTNYNYFLNEPDLTYSFDYGNSHFIGIDVTGDVGLLGGTEKMNWLNNDLTAAENRGLTHAFIFFHGPIYCIGEHCACTDRLGCNPPFVLTNIINAHPIITATFHGHEHANTYTYIDSTRIPEITNPFHQFVTGPAGATLYENVYSERYDYYMGREHGFITIDVDGVNVEINWYQLGDSSIQHTLLIDKESTPALSCIDTDGDLYGNPASVSCIFSELDCNDNDFSINPGQTEICENGIDDNCNNLIDENCAICGDGICQNQLGEDYLSCSQDCFHEADIDKNSCVDTLELIDYIHRYENNDGVTLGNIEEITCGNSITMCCPLNL